MTRLFLILLTVLAGACYPIPIQAQDAGDASDQAPFFERQPSRRKAILLSLAVPGLGHAYTGNWKRAKVYFAAEAVTWATFAAFRVYGGWRADDYRILAADRAGVRLSGQNDAFFKQVGLFGSSAVYNQDQRLTLRSQGRIYSGGDSWSWVSDADRLRYQAIRKASQRARVRSYCLVGFAIASRVASAVDIRRSLPVSSRIPSLNLYMPPDGSVWMVAHLSF